MKLAIVFGGVDYEKQRKVLEDGVDVLIGTPGRIIDYFKQGVFDLRHIQVAVMDEADRMFDLGFIKDIRFILRRLPHPELRLTMMFSATLSHRVMELAYEHMNNPELIRIEPDKMTVDRVKQVLYFPATEGKNSVAHGAAAPHRCALRTMVFVNTKRIAEVLERTLTANGFVAQALSGDVPQNKRLKMMRDFHNGEIAVLIATDVASRGLHIPDVSHVFNFDLPNDAEDYVHRIGRTARAGAEGDAISFGCEEYAISLPDIESYIGHQIPRASIEAADLAAVTAPPLRPYGASAPRVRVNPAADGGGRRPAVAAPAHPAAPAAVDDRPLRPTPRPAARRRLPRTEARRMPQQASAKPRQPANRRLPPAPIAHRARGQNSPRSAPQTAPSPARRRWSCRRHPQSRRRRPHGLTEGPGEQLCDSVDGDEVARALRRRARVGISHRAQVRNPEMARGLQHRQTVIHEQRPRRRKLFLGQQ